MKIADLVYLNKRSISKTNRPDHILYLDTSNLTDNEIGDLQCFDMKDAPSRAQRLVENNTILFSLVRPKLRHIGILKNPQSNLVVSTGFATIDVKDGNICDADYLYYFLSQDCIIEALHTIGENAVSAYPTITPNDIANLTIDLPTIECQRGIAGILTAIDKKIALNRQINHNLEAIARQLYDYWFVQFDFPDENGKPYRSNGGKMVWSEQLKSEVPEGWNECKFGTLCYSNIANLSNDDDFEIIQYLDTSSLTRNIIDGLQPFRLTEAPSRAQRKVIDGTILYSTVRPRLEHYGIIHNPKANMIVSTGFATFDAKEKEYRYFLYLFLIQSHISEYLGKIADTAVSSYPSINISDIEDLKVVKPEWSIMKKFHSFIKPIFENIENNSQGIISCTKLRDELLPLLMNGQATVNYDLSPY